MSQLDQIWSKGALRIFTVCVQMSRSEIDLSGKDSLPSRTILFISKEV